LEDPVTAQPWPVADPSVLAPVPEHEALRTVLRGLLETHAPHDEVRRAAALDEGWSPKLWSLLNDEMDVGSLAVPEERGGQGFGVAVLAVVLEEAGRALLPEPLLLSSVLGVRAVLAAPEGALPDELVTGVLEGRLVVTMALGEAAAAELTLSDTSGPATVSGHIGRVPVGGAADLVVVGIGPPGRESIHLVDLRGTGEAVRTELEVLDLTRRQARLDLEGAPAHLIAPRDETDALTTELAILGRVALAAEHVGMVEALLNMTREHVAVRNQFDRPLASFQVIKHRLADMLVDLERARSAARYAAVVFDQDPFSAELPSAVAAAVCTEAVIRAAHEAVQLHGGIGFTWEHPAHYYLRRALADEAVFGSARSDRALVARLLGL
jgi:alkylation response protein AidB-like acyl-CoA dehydrogenase